VNLRAAVVGTGFVGRAHIEGASEARHFHPGVLESSVTRTQEACRALGIARAYTSMEELTGDRSVEVVHVCTPNHLHFTQTQSALQAGKHVICEKPLAMSTGETAVLVSLAQKHAQVGAVNYNLRYYPLCQEAHALVQRGAIGEPRLVLAVLICKIGCFIQTTGTGGLSPRWEVRCERLPTLARTGWI